MNVLVLGPAKTGTTAVSKAIHQALPGSDYKLEPKQTQFFMRPAQPAGAVVKIIYEHWNDRRHLRNAIIHNEMPLKFDRVVATMRDPRDEIVSRMYFVARAAATNGRHDAAAIDAWIDVLRAKEADPSAVSFATICDHARRILGVELRPDASIFERYHKYLVGTPKRIHVMRYEDFVDGRLDALSNHLGLVIRPDPELGSHAYTRRSGEYGEWRRIFTPEDVATFGPSLAPVLAEMGYTDWSLVKEPRLDPASRSEYARRLVDEVRQQKEAAARPEAMQVVLPFGSRFPQLETRATKLARDVDRAAKKVRAFVRKATR